MPKSKSSPSSRPVAEVIETPWLAAYRTIHNTELGEGETTIRQFMRDCGIKNYSRAKFAISEMVKAGLVEVVGECMLAQDGLRPARVCVYRLIEKKPRVMSEHRRPAKVIRKVIK